MGPNRNVGAIFRTRKIGFPGNSKLCRLPHRESGSLVVISTLFINQKIKTTQ
jgi:hypothetical protein